MPDQQDIFREARHREEQRARRTEYLKNVQLLLHDVYDPRHDHEEQEERADQHRRPVQGDLEPRRFIAGQRPATDRFQQINAYPDSVMKVRLVPLCYNERVPLLPFDHLQSRCDTTASSVFTVPIVKSGLHDLPSRDMRGPFDELSSDLRCVKAATSSTTHNLQ